MSKPSVIKPRTMPGVMELLPAEQMALNRMIAIIRKHYTLFGFVPIETPVIELTDVLLTKSGGDTERQVYFVQSTGGLEKYAENPQKRPELAMRFDLTVPLARYVAEHEHDLQFPFRRQQIQRVYRGERAQRGRYREFYQCDIDVIGKDSLPIAHDAEVPAVIHAIFTELDFGAFTISLNNRRLMQGYLARLGISDAAAQADVLREIDKLDKRGVDEVAATLAERDDLTDDTVAQLMAFVGFSSTNYDEALAHLASLPDDNETLTQGKQELTQVLQQLQVLGVPQENIRLNFAIARGLDYYTGTVFETHLDDYPQIGSVCSGGRYENLAGQYTKSSLPGVGISIGATRLFWQLKEAGLIQIGNDSDIKAFVVLMSDDDRPHALALATQLRTAGVPTQVQLQAKKMGKQFQYADRSGIRYVVIQGEDERARGVVSVKDMQAGEQFEWAVDIFAEELSARCQTVS